MHLFSYMTQLSKILLLTLLSKYVSEAIASDFSNGVRSFGAVKCLFLSENLEAKDQRVSMHSALPTMNYRKQRQRINTCDIPCTFNQGTKAHKTYGTQLRVSFWARAYVAPYDKPFSRPVLFWAFFAMLSHWHVTCWQTWRKSYLGDSKRTGNKSLWSGTQT